MPESRLVRSIFKGCAALVMLGVLAVGVLFGSLWLEHGAELTLPTPTGPFAVGRAIYDWTDDAALDSLAPMPGTKRELLVWIWYPAAPRQSVEPGQSVATGKSAAVMDDYVPAQLRPKGDSAKGALLWRLLTRDLSKVHGHSSAGSAVSGQQQSYPVVIMRAGASAPVVNYSTLAEDLASHGYVVVGFDAPYRTGRVVFPDGRVMHRRPENNPERCAAQEQARQDGCMKRVLAAWTSDIAFVLDRLAELNSSDSTARFTGHLDMTRVGVFGHSLGGATAAQFCHDDSRCKAGIDVDGQPFGSVVQEGMHQPFMFVLSDQVHGTDPETRQILANIQSIYDRLPPDGRLRIAIRGANHFTFSDDGALLKSHIVLRTLRMLGLFGIDGRRQLAVTAYCVHSFFDAYLRSEPPGTGGSRPSIASPRYPEIQVLE